MLFEFDPEAFKQQNERNELIEECARKIIATLELADRGALATSRHDLLRIRQSYGNEVFNLASRIANEHKYGKRKHNV